jgi:hypothetical protein
MKKLNRILPLILSAGVSCGTGCQSIISDGADFLTNSRYVLFTEQRENYPYKPAEFRKLEKYDGEKIWLRGVPAVNEKVTLTDGKHSVQCWDGYEKPAENAENRDRNLRGLIRGYDREVKAIGVMRNGCLDVDFIKMGDKVRRVFY